MSSLDIGRICMKKPGREAGRRCVIIDVIDKNFVLVTGPKDVTGVRKRKANIDHLEPTEFKIDVSRGASDDEVKEALKRFDRTQTLTAPTPPSKAKEEKKVVVKPQAKTVKTRVKKTGKKIKAGEASK